MLTFDKYFNDQKIKLVLFIVKENRRPNFKVIELLQGNAPAFCWMGEGMGFSSFSIGSISSCFFCLEVDDTVVIMF